MCVVLRSSACLIRPASSGLPHPACLFDLPTSLFITWRCGDSSLHLVLALLLLALLFALLLARLRCLPFDVEELHLRSGSGSTSTSRGQSLGHTTSRLGLSQGYRQDSWVSSGHIAAGPQTEAWIHQGSFHPTRHLHTRDPMGLSASVSHRRTSCVRKSPFSSNHGFVLSWRAEVTRRLSHEGVPYPRRPLSQPLITMPLPRVNVKGSSRSRDCEGDGCHCSQTFSGSAQLVCECYN